MVKKTEGPESTPTSSIPYCCYLPVLTKFGRCDRVDPSHLKHNTIRITLFNNDSPFIEFVRDTAIGDQGILGHDRRCFLH